MHSPVVVTITGAFRGGLTVAAGEKGEEGEGAMWRATGGASQRTCMDLERGKKKGGREREDNGGARMTIRRWRGREEGMTMDARRNLDIAC